MKTYEVQLKETYKVEGGILKCILMDKPLDNDAFWRRPAMIVVPGGGYGNVSKREGEPIAAEFLARGYQTFVLTYLCAPSGVRYPEQLIELACAVDYVRKHADELCVNPDEIFVVGFSAGGHLTANLAVDHQNVSVRAGMELDCRPTAVGLSYPVITHKTVYQGTHNNLLNGYSDEAKEELYKEVDLDEVVTENTAPSFIWTTATDNVVPAENSLRFALALARNKVPYELHIYPEGNHGLSNGALEINHPVPCLKRLSAWVNECTEFFKRFKEEKSYL